MPGSRLKLGWRIAVWITTEQGEDFGLGLASFDRDVTEGARLITASRLRQGRSTNDDRSIVVRRFGELLKARGDIYAIPNHGVVQPFLGAHVAGHHPVRVDADA